MTNWFKRLFGGDSERTRTVKEAAKDAGIYEGAIRHKGDARKVRNDAFAENLEKNVEKRARKRSL